MTPDKTREEIYEKHIGTNMEMGYLPTPKENVLAAMDEYAASCSVAFAEWATNLKWTYNPYTKLWSNYDDNIERKIQSDQLYKLFIHGLNK